MLLDSLVSSTDPGTDAMPSKDIWNYKKYWNPKAIKERKMYKTNEIDDVLSDVESILNKFEVILDHAAANIHVANKNLNSQSALASLVTADMQLKSIDLIPVIDTIHGILEDGEDDGTK